MNIYQETLKKYWGYDSFRPLQEDIIHSIYEGHDTVGLMPTGGGKSITFQVPALILEGVCIVVTPLIALMKDQVDNLKKLGIKATSVHSGMTRQEIITQLENCIFGDYKFLYVSPERLSTEIFLLKLNAMNVSMLVVDESHCISQWGYDFRPSYLKIADIRKQLSNVPILALTATATPQVVEDIKKQLELDNPNVFIKSFSRKNLAYIVRKTEDKLHTLVYILNKVPGTGIVYVRNRKKTKEIAEYLQKEGISADYYHAGLNNDIKTIKQNKWKNDEIRVIVSTNAFGMGIDKPDVRIVIHMDMPGSLEEYYQEAGRAGRDEKKSFAVVLYSPGDSAQLKKRLTDEFPQKEFIYRVYEALGNYYQIAVGFGLDTVHDFILSEFCKTYKLPLIQTHNALKLLELSGYIEYLEEIDTNSRLMFNATREELYTFLQQNELIDNIIRTILRSYTGLFSDYAYVNESLIALRAKCTQEEVYNVLVNLSKYRIINYIPKKRNPLIIYRQVREEQKYLSIPKSAYEDRKERYEERIAKVLEYLNTEQICRTRILLDYFGEKTNEDCNTCDICLQKHNSGLTNGKFNNIRKALIEQTESGPSPVTELCESIPYPKEMVVKAIRFLIDNDEHFHLEDQNLSFKE